MKLAKILLTGIVSALMVAPAAFAAQAAKTPAATTRVAPKCKDCMAKPCTGCKNDKKASKVECKDHKAGQPCKSKHPCAKCKGELKASKALKNEKK